MQLRPVVGLRRLHMAVRVREYHTKEQRKDEPCREHAEAPNEGRSIYPANPHRRKPDETSEQSQVADPARRSAERHNTGQDKSDPGNKGERRGELGVPGVSRQPAGALRNRQRTHAGGNHD